ncbi:SecDF P1 head subdomain-containing protein [Microbacterium halophytorum]|uniref:SecDF P1 head subdomain-containing protein n=1 Tax=Microbacterium halophytorum TaxID=2067568 RepID=UPI000CFAC1B4|nr:hypothetical protein [Microbacterium halophytorum]
MKHRALSAGLLVALAAGTAGCSLLPGGAPDDEAALATPVTLAAVTEIIAGECPSGEDNAIDTSWPGEDGAAECTVLSSDERINIVDVTVRLVPLGESDPAQEAIVLELGEAASGMVEDLTASIAENQPPQNQMAIVVDGEVVSRPAVMEPISGPEIQITGGGSMEELFAELTE